MLSNLQDTINGRRRVYLVRHGNVSYFDATGKPYHQDEVPLDSEGVAQARRLAEELRPVPIDRLVVTGLPRTVETAEIIAEDRALDPEVRPELREVAPGRLADIPAADIERVFTTALSGDVRPEDRFLGGESFGSLEARVLPCFRSLLDDDDWRSLLIVAHGGTNRVIISWALGAGLRGIGRIEQDPACLNVLDVNLDGSFIVRLLNYSPYSPVKDGIHLTTMEKIFSTYRPAGSGETERGRRA